jgi:tetratricopeptide (TPR) repeat protein
MINAAAALCLRGDYAEAVRRADEALVLSRAAGDRMRECDALVVRCESDLHQDRLGDALADAEKALVLAQASEYRYMWASAQHQRARILTAMGREVEAAHARKLGGNARAQLGGTHRDPTIEKLLAATFPTDDAEQEVPQEPARLATH